MTDTPDPAALARELIELREKAAKSRKFVVAQDPTELRCQAIGYQYEYDPHEYAGVWLARELRKEDAEFILAMYQNFATVARWALEQHEAAKEAERLRERVAKLEGGIKMLRHYTQYGIDNQTAAKLDASDFIRIREACTEYLKESPT